MKKRLHNKLATFAGLITAISTAWITIDWASFEVARDYPKLILSGLIAVGGWFSSFNKKDNGNS